jgi:tRNA dimethylallyltransferase
MSVEPKLIAVIGPTASGKSALAMRIAREIGAEILSVDSMQVYREMNVGTAKPTSGEKEMAVHHLIDVVGPDEVFTAARFVQMADEVIAEARRRGVPLVAVGGTPLYFKSLFIGMFEGPGADEDVRARLRALDNAELHSRLTRVDPAAAQRIHVNDTKRLIRALEVHELTGQPISSLQTEWADPQSRHDAVWLGLHWDREALNRRINARVKQMLDQGWLDEARRLQQKYGELSPTASEATGYALLFDHLAGKISLDDATEQIKIATRQLARRQMKWFRRFANVRWIVGSDDAQVTDVGSLIADR